MKIIPTSTLLLFSLISFGCFSISIDLRKQSKPKEVQQESKLHHIVLCWLKDSGNEKGRKEIIEITEIFQDIPGVISAQAGEVVLSDRDIVDDSFDVGIIIVTKDQEDLQKYLDHPIHQKAKKEVLLPLVKKVLVYDIID